MTDHVPVEETLRHQGWSLIEDRYDRRFERDGLSLSFDSHWSVQQYFVSSATGGWGNLQEIMSRIGLSVKGDDSDFLEAAFNAKTIKIYLDSSQFEKDKQARRHERMNKLREFQHDIGMKESFLSGEENYLYLRSQQRIGYRGVALKYWIVAAASALYLVYWVSTAENTMKALMIVGVGFAMMGSGILALFFQKKI